MTTQTLARAIKGKKSGEPAVIKENGAPQFVVLDWDAYQKWQEWKEDMEDHARFEIAERQSRGKKRYSLREVKKRHGFL